MFFPWEGWFVPSFLFCLNYFHFKGSCPPKWIIPVIELQAVKHSTPFWLVWTTDQSYFLRRSANFGASPLGFQMLLYFWLAQRRGALITGLMESFAPTATLIVHSYLPVSWKVAKAEVYIEWQKRNGLRLVKLQKLYEARGRSLAFRNGKEPILIFQMMEKSVIHSWAVSPNPSLVYLDQD